MYELIAIIACRSLSQVPPGTRSVSLSALPFPTLPTREIRPRTCIMKLSLSLSLVSIHLYPCISSQSESPQGRPHTSLSFSLQIPLYLSIQVNVPTPACLLLVNCEFRWGGDLNETYRVQNASCFFGLPLNTGDSDLSKCQNGVVIAQWKSRAGSLLFFMLLTTDAGFSSIFLRLLSS